VGSRRSATGYVVAVDLDDFRDLFADTTTLTGRIVTSVVVVAAAWALGRLVGGLVARRRSDPFDRYVTAKLVRYTVNLLAVIVLAAMWRPFAGRFGVVLGIVTAGVAFAMQEVIGSFAGWVSISTGRLYRVGDRVDVGGVRGDVIDITPLRTMLMEMGSPGDSGSWVGGRQLTGRIVSVSNKNVFTNPVYNYSSSFDFLWEELVVPIPYDADWRRAEAILAAAVASQTAGADARLAVERMRRSYPIPQTDLEPRVFVRLTDDWVELAARFVVPVRTARAVKDELSRHVLYCLEAEGIEVASSTSTVTVRSEADGD
jgi:small-conductance mechanosensitive channel